MYFMMSSKHLLCLYIYHVAQCMRGNGYGKDIIMTIMFRLITPDNRLEGGESTYNQWMAIGLAS